MNILKNLIPDSNFDNLKYSDGSSDTSITFENWIISNSINIDSDDAYNGGYCLSLDKEGTMNTTPAFNLISGNFYYFRVYHKSKNPNTTFFASFNDMFVIPLCSYDFESNEDEWTFSDVIFYANKTTNNVALAFKLTNGNDYDLKIDSVMLVNLTEVFGEIIPTKEWCANKIPYFVDTYKVKLTDFNELNININPNPDKYVFSNENKKWYLKKTKTNVIEKGYTETEERITLQPGTYVIEAYGAQGGCLYNDDYNRSYVPGTEIHDLPGHISLPGHKGGYVKTIIDVKKEINLYVNVGGTGGSQNHYIDSYTQLNMNGGYNGGGSGCGQSGAGGGGATTIALSSCRLQSNGGTQTQLDNLLLIAGGGGASNTHHADRIGNNVYMNGDNATPGWTGSWEQDEGGGGAGYTGGLSVEGDDAYEGNSGSSHSEIGEFANYALYNQTCENYVNEGNGRIVITELIEDFIVTCDNSSDISHYYDDGSSSIIFIKETNADNDIKTIKYYIDNYNDDLNTFKFNVVYYHTENHINGEYVCSKEFTFYNSANRNILETNLDYNLSYASSYLRKLTGKTNAFDYCPTDIDVYINGMKQPPVMKTDFGFKESIFETDLYLSDGLNKIEVVATTIYGNTNKVYSEIIVDITPPKKEKKELLSNFIGNDDNLVDLNLGNADLEYVNKDAGYDKNVKIDTTIANHYFGLEGINSQFYRISKDKIPLIKGDIIKRPLIANFDTIEKEYDGTTDISIPLKQLKLDNGYKFLDVHEEYNDYNTIGLSNGTTERRIIETKILSEDEKITKAPDLVEVTYEEGLDIIGEKKEFPAPCVYYKRENSFSHKAVTFYTGIFKLHNKIAHQTFTTYEDMERWVKTSYSNSYYRINTKNINLTSLELNLDGVIGYTLLGTNNDGEIILDIDVPYTTTTLTKYNSIVNEGKENILGVGKYLATETVSLLNGGNKTIYHCLVVLTSNNDKFIFRDFENEEQADKWLNAYEQAITGINIVTDSEGFSTIIFNMFDDESSYTVKNGIYIKYNYNENINFEHTSSDKGYVKLVFEMADFKTKDVTNTIEPIRILNAKLVGDELGDLSHNYQIANVLAFGKIIKKPITAYVTAVDKIYDGSPYVPFINGGETENGLVGVVGHDDVFINNEFITGDGDYTSQKHYFKRVGLSYLECQDCNVGMSKPIIRQNIVVQGNDFKNYYLKEVFSSSVANILKRDINIVINKLRFIRATRTYEIDYYFENDLKHDNLTIVFNRLDDLALKVYGGVEVETGKEIADNVLNQIDIIPMFFKDSTYQRTYDYKFINPVSEIETVEGTDTNYNKLSVRPAQPDTERIDFEATHDVNYPGEIKLNLLDEPYFESKDGKYRLYNNNKVIVKNINLDNLNDKYKNYNLINSEYVTTLEII